MQTISEQLDDRLLTLSRSASMTSTDYSTEDIPPHHSDHYSKWFPGKHVQTLEIKGQGNLVMHPIDYPEGAGLDFYIHMKPIRQTRAKKRSLQQTI